MPPKSTPGTPAEWLARAESSLQLGSTQVPGVALEDLCFQVQQAVEKALKAAILARVSSCPYVHDLDLLLERLSELGLDIPPEVEAASTLTRYAMETRYPNLIPPVTLEEYQEALAMAGTVLAWVRGILR
jgi:HEPN domain-containing protein